MSTPSQLDVLATTAGAASDYFAVFTLPRKLTIDVMALEKQFYKLSRKLHPDLHAQASAEQQAAMLAQSSQLNDAYRTLKNPVARVEYLLELLGVRINENNAAKKTDAPRVPADLLEEVFELNMQLEEMRANKKTGEDDPQLRADLEKARTQFTDQLAAVDSELQQKGTAWDSAVDSDDEATKSEIARQLAGLLDRRGYLRNLVRDVNETLEPAS
jgi:molecular chaperone HscB